MADAKTPLLDSSRDAAGISMQILPGLAPVSTTAYGPDCGAQLNVVDRPVGARHNLRCSALQGVPNSIAARAGNVPHVFVATGAAK